MTFDEYLADLPLLHTWDGGSSWNTGGFQPEHLRQIHAFLAPRFPAAGAIIETGAGNSTLTFLQLAPGRMVSIAPDADLRDRIIGAAQERSIDTAPFDFRSTRSELALPALALNEERFDVALIDGGHGWPTVFVDFCYLNMMLPKGGLLLVDDVTIYGIAELCRLLEAQEDYELVEDFGKLRVWEKRVKRPFLPGHSFQPYITQQTKRDRIRRRLRLVR